MRSFWLAGCLADSQCLCAARGLQHVSAVKLETTIKLTVATDQLYFSSIRWLQLAVQNFHKIGPRDRMQCEYNCYSSC